MRLIARLVAITALLCFWGWISDGLPDMGCVSGLGFRRGL